MITDSQYKDIIALAKKHAYSIENKLPSTAKAYNSNEDISQTLLLHVIEKSKSYDSTKDLQNWALVLFKNKGIDIVEKAWTYYKNTHTYGLTRNIALDFIQDTNSSHLPSCDKTFCNRGRGTSKTTSVFVETVYVDDRDSESLYIELQNKKECNNTMARIENEVRELCKQFHMEYEREEMFDCLVNVLNYVLNDMSDEEFQKLPYEMQERLAWYGEGLKAKSLKVTRTGKIRTIGIKAAIREIVGRGVVEYAQVKRELDILGIVSREKSTRYLIWKERTDRGLPIVKKTEGIHAKIAQFFDLGRGIVTVPEMRKKLKEENIDAALATVRICMHKLRKTAGLTSVRD